MDNSNFKHVDGISCAEFLGSVDDFFDGTLDETRARAIELHANECSACARSLSETKQLLAVARSLRNIPIPEGVHLRLMDAIRARSAKDPSAN